MKSPSRQIIQLAVRMFLKKDSVVVGYTLECVFGARDWFLMMASLSYPNVAVMHSLTPMDYSHTAMRVRL